MLQSLSVINVESLLKLYLSPHLDSTTQLQLQSTQELEMGRGSREKLHPD